jgi:hypothetical protein
MPGFPVIMYIDNELYILFKHYISDLTLKEVFLYVRNGDFLKSRHLQDCRKRSAPGMSARLEHYRNWKNNIRLDCWQSVPSRAVQIAGMKSLSFDHCA